MMFLLLTLTIAQQGYFFLGGKYSTVNDRLLDKIGPAIVMTHSQYLEQAGVHATWMKLGDMGIHGNGHMIMLEKNNMEVAEQMSRWLTKVLPAAATKKSK